MRIIWLCILALCAAIVLHIAYEAYQNHIHSGAIPGYLAKYAIPTITNDGIDYTIIGGGIAEVDNTALEQRLLRLAYFATAARIDPLFALPGTDLNTFYLTIDELEVSQERIASVYGPEEQEIIRGSLYPISFLRSLHRLEYLRRELITTPSFANAEKYQQQFAKSYELYVENIDALQNAIRILVPEKIKKGVIRFHTGNSSVEFITNTLNKYKNGATETYKKHINRFHCYEGKYRHCIEIIRPKLPLTEQLNISDEYKNMIIHHRDFIKTLRQAPYRGYGHSYDSIEISTSRCGDLGKPGFYYPWWREDYSELPVFRPDLLHNLYFYDFWNGRQSHWWYAQLHREQGGPQYVYQPIANHYACPDLGLDMASVLSTLFVEEKKLRITPIVSESRSEIDGFIDAANTAYDAVTTDPQHLTQTTIRAYIDALHALLSAVTEAELYEYIGIATTRTAHDLIIVYYARTAHLPDVLMSIINNNEAVIDYALHNTHTGLGELLLLQTGPMTLYGGFTPTIQPQPLSFIREFISGPPDIVVTLEDLEIKDTMAFIRDLWRGMEIDIDMSSSVGTFYPTVPSN